MRGTKETNMARIALAVLALAALAVPAQANPACLQIGRIWSWKALDNKTLVVEDKLHQKFRVRLMGYCPRLPFKLDLGFKSNAGINGLECLAKGDDVIERDIGGGYRCPVTSITPYTPAMEKADRAAGQGASY
jgi:hypothetical protein